MSTEEELRDDLHDEFADASYPVENQMDLMPALSNGPTTTFTGGDVSLTAMELATKLGSQQDFPYEDVDNLVDDIIEGLQEEDVL